jgi:hypothetical protein
MVCANKLEVLRSVWACSTNDEIRELYRKFGPETAGGRDKSRVRRCWCSGCSANRPEEMCRIILTLHKAQSLRAVKSVTNTGVTAGRYPVQLGNHQLLKKESATRGECMIVITGLVHTASTRVLCALSVFP